jgi:DNA-directed RNA polymerase beta subunit
MSAPAWNASRRAIPARSLSANAPALWIRSIPNASSSVWKAAHEGQMSREVGADIYQMTKFKRSNQNTCINQKPIAQGQR